MAAANRLLVSDYGLGVWAGFQASHDSRWVPKVFLWDEPKGVLAKVLAAGPARIILPKNAPNNSWSPVILPGTGKFIFADDAGHLQIVTATGGREKDVVETEDIQTFDLSSQLSDPVGVTSQLVSASELDGGSIALMFRQFRSDPVRSDQPIDDKLVILNLTGTSKVYSGNDIVDQSDSLKQRIGEWRTHKGPDFDIGSPWLLMKDRDVYVYLATSLLMVIDLFSFDPGSTSGFKQGFLYEDNPQPRFYHRYYAVNGLLIVSDKGGAANNIQSSNGEKPSQPVTGTPTRPRFKILEVLDLHSEASDQANGNSPKAVWTDIVSQSQILTICNKPDSLYNCSIQNLQMLNRESKMMFVSVTMENKETKKSNNWLVVVDTKSLAIFTLNRQKF
jgi:hypothetical protein